MRSFAPVLVGATGTTTTIAFEAIAVASAVGVLLRARWDWLALTVFALSAPQWLGWLFHSHSVIGVVAVLCLFGALYVAAALGFELRMPSERLRASSTLVLALNALMLGCRRVDAADRSRPSRSRADLARPSWRRRI